MHIYTEIPITFLSLGNWGEWDCVWALSEGSSAFSSPTVSLHGTRVSSHSLALAGLVSPVQDPGGPCRSIPAPCSSGGSPWSWDASPVVDSHAWGDCFLLWRGWSLTPWLVSCCAFIPHYGGFVQPVSGLFQGNCSTCSCVFVLSLGGGELRLSSYTLNRTPAPHHKFNWLFISVEEKVNSVVVQTCPHIYIWSLFNW